MRVYCIGNPYVTEPFEREIAIWETGGDVIHIGLVVYKRTGRTFAGLRVYEFVG